MNDWHVASRRLSSPRRAVKQNDRRNSIGIQTGWYSGGGECAVAYCYENVAQKVAKEYGNVRGWNSVCT